MSFSVEIEKVFEHQSERVKSVDLHPTQPWILTGLYSGTLCIWNYESQVIVKSIKITESPIRSAKFIERKQWIIAGSDDKFIRVYDYNTMEKVTEFEAHADYIRSFAVHPDMPYVLSASDDKSIKLWDWEKNWTCAQIFDGHDHYVMQVAFNPNDTNTFVTVSLDSKVKIWKLGSAHESFTLDGHSKGINCVEFFTTGDKAYLITGSDDFTAKIWDYEAKTCIQTLEGHTHNVSALCVHPQFPVIITGSEDESVRIWQAKDCNFEKKLEYNLGRIWGFGCTVNSPLIVIGFDKGTIVGKITCSTT
jgi:coatomer subunit beta'